MFQQSICVLTAIAVMVSLAVAAEEKRPLTPYGVLYYQWKAEVTSLDEATPELAPADKAAKKQQINSRYTSRFLQLAKQHPSDDLWLDCLIWVSGQGRGEPGADFDAMFDLLRVNAATVGNTIQLQLLMSEFIPLRSEHIDPALTTILETHPDSGVRGAALYALAARTKSRAEQHGDEQGLTTATKLLERVLADFPEVTTYRGENSKNATKLLEDLRSPVAPNTQGKTISGDRFDLSQTIRGKVAVISFSGHWCGPCVAMHPVQKEIISRFPKDAVVLVEMNSDAPESLEKVRKKMLADGLEWIVVTDGSHGPASEQWRVTEWPTYVAVDASGQIRRRATGNVGQLLTTWVEELVSERK